MGSLETEGSRPRDRPVTLKNMMDENQVFSDSLHLKASGVSVLSIYGDLMKKSENASAHFLINKTHIYTL